jgi:hypothetical protein
MNVIMIATAIGHFLPPVAAVRGLLTDWPESRAREMGATLAEGLITPV